jgi:hypothetical protein
MKKEELLAQKQFAKRVELEEIKMIHNGSSSIFSPSAEKPNKESSPQVGHLETINSLSPLKGAELMDSNSKGSYLKALDSSMSNSISPVKRRGSTELLSGLKNN